MDRSYDICGWNQNRCDNGEVTACGIGRTFTALSSNRAKRTRSDYQLGKIEVEFLGHEESRMRILSSDGHMEPIYESVKFAFEYLLMCFLGLEGYVSRFIGVFAGFLKLLFASVFHAKKSLVVIHTQKKWRHCLYGEKFTVVTDRMSFC